MPEEGHGQAGSRGIGGVALHVLDRLWKVVSNAAGLLSEHRGTQLAASMAYYALLSVFPAAIVLAAVAGAVIDDHGTKQQVIDYLLRNLPLSESSGRNDIATLLDGVTATPATLGVIGVVALLISASALVSAARNSLNLIFGEDVRAGLLRGKALDVLLVVRLGALFVISFVASIAGRFQVELNGWLGDIIDHLDRHREATRSCRCSSPGCSSRSPSRCCPRSGGRSATSGRASSSPRSATRSSGAGFGIYLDGFSHYSAVYGSLGAVVAFMFFVYLAALVFLLGAEMAAVLARRPRRGLRRRPGRGGGVGGRSDRGLAQEPRLAQSGRSLTVPSTARTPGRVPL